MKGLPSVKLDIRVWILALQVCVAGCYLLIRWGWITDIFRNGVTVVEVSLEKSNCENHPLRFKLIISSTSSAKLDETGQIHLFIESRSWKSVLYAGDNTRIWKQEKASSYKVHFFDDDEHEAAKGNKVFLRVIELSESSQTQNLCLPEKHALWSVPDSEWTHATR